MKRITYFLLLVIVTISCKKSDDNPNIVIDIDGNEYEIIEIGEQVWMKSNLKTTKYNDGVVIPKLEDDADWLETANGAWCFYNNDPANNNIYGKLYNAHAAMSGKLCPIGWRIPNSDDWQGLIDFLGGDEFSAGGALKSITGWNEPNIGATNTTGFTALPGGTRDNSSGIFNQMGDIAYFWSSSSVEDEKTLYSGLESSTTLLFSYSVERNYGFSCRCIKGAE